MRIIKICRYWKFFLLFNLIIRSSLPHVVFEEFGTMAGSVSYMHLTLHVNLSHVDNLIQGYKRQCVDLRDLISSLFEAVIKERHPTNRENYEKNRDDATFVIQAFIDAANEEMRLLNNLRGVLPKDQQRAPQRLIYRESRSADHSFPTQELFKKLSGNPNVSKGAREILELLSKKGLHLSSKTGQIKKVFKIARVLKGISPLSMGFSLAKGIFGTFMGLYNAYQMEKLRSDLNGVIQTQNRVLEVLEDHQQQLQTLDSELQELKLRFTIWDSVKLPVISSQLTQGLNIIRGAVQQAIHAVQEAHHHRLSIDYFDPETLLYLYETLEAQATESQYHLLTRFPSDLFQLELSYLFDGADLVLFLHVPMVPKESLLTLYRLRPFPIPFSESMALLPKPSSTLLALSSGIPRSMTHIEHADLVDCHSVNQVYLCERHGVLRNHIKSSCLGALFEQDIKTAQSVCDLELIPYEEAVLQLKNNWFLIYSPIMHTAYVQCFNSTSAARPIKIGVNQIFVDPSCRMELKNHTLTSDLSMKLDAEITYFPWALADLSAFGVTEEDIKAALAVRTTAGERNIYLVDVIQHRQFSASFPKWKYVLSALSISGIILLIFIVALSLGAHRVIAFRQRMRKIRDAVESIKHLPGARPLSRRQSLAQPLIPDSSAPPLYPGLPPSDPEEGYELMTFNQDNLAQSIRNLSRLSRSASRLTNHLQSKLSLARSCRSSSAPASNRSSKVSFFQQDHFNDLTLHPDDLQDDDALSTTSHPDFDGDRSIGKTSAPTPALRTKTPSYMFLKATNTSEV